MNRATVVFASLLALAFPLSLLAGRVWIDPASTQNAALILGELRLPRSILAVVIGAGLGMAGAAMQGYLRNPLADPGLFGIAPGAALGAVIALRFGIAGVYPLERNGPGGAVEDAGFDPDILRADGVGETQPGDIGEDDVEDDEPSGE